MKVDTTPLPSDLQETVQELIERSMFEIQQDRFSSVMFLLNSSTRSYSDFNLGKIPRDMKDLYAVLLQKYALKNECDIAITLLDGWGLSEEDVPRYNDILEEYGTIANYPKRLSFFVTCVETPTTLYYGHVQQNADKSFPLMTFEKKPRGGANAVGGRLTGIIPQQVMQ